MVLSFPRIPVQYYTKKQGSILKVASPFMTDGMSKFAMLDEFNIYIQASKQLQLGFP